MTSFNFKSPWKPLYIQSVIPFKIMHAIIIQISWLILHISTWLKMQFLKIKESNTRQSNAFHQPWKPAKAASPTQLNTIWLVPSSRRQRRNITKFSWNHKPNKSQNYRNSHFTNTPNSNLPQKTWWTIHKFTYWAYSMRSTKRLSVSPPL